MPSPDKGNAPVVVHQARMGDERVSRGASFALLAQMIAAVLTAFLTIFLGRALSAQQYGAFTFALSVIMIATLFADMGVTTSTGRFLAERRDQPSAAAAVLRTALRLKLQIGIPVAVALFIFARPLCQEFGTPDAAWAVRGCAIALLSQSIFGLFTAAFVALGRLRYTVVMAFIESVTETTATFALVLLTATAAAAAFGRAIGFTVGLVAVLAIAGRTIGSLRARNDVEQASAVSARRIVAYAGPLLFVDAAFRVFSSIDVLLIAALVGGGPQIAAFGLPMRFAAFLEFPAGALATAVAPRFARRRQGDVRVLSDSLRYLIIIQTLLAAPLLIWSQAIIHLLFGGKYTQAPEVLRALSPYVFLGGGAQLVTLAVNYLGQARRRIPIAITMLTVNVAIDVVLLPRIGVVAAAIGTSAAYAIWVPAHIWMLRQQIGLRIRPLLVTTARCCIGGAAMVGVLAALGTGVVPVPLLLVGAVAGPLAYVIVLFALRELTSEDVATLRGIIARRAG
jgi:O-antigen/teichoic acid export membrane protein